MAQFETYNLDNVKDAGRKTLESIEKGYGFVPNLLGTMIESPATTNAYLALGKLFGQTSFTDGEQQVISLTASRVNECEYCVSAHSTVARGSALPGDVIDAIRGDQPIADERLEALRLFVAQTVNQRGWLDNEQIEAFLDAGFTKEQVFEVVLGVSMKTISNYINHIASTELDEAFAAEAWHAPREAVA
ncbi:MAG: carboxymuconolactone decarboxylase family protein [Woeseiaceae bacterium]|nr:carboxymuconolactone decarboxylase family protein [Woeseiaceae bacterium]